MDGSEKSWTTMEDDRATEAAVLQLLLDLHPTQLTVAELVREIGGEQIDFAQRDAIERAGRALPVRGERVSRLAQCPARDAREGSPVR